MVIPVEYAVMAGRAYQTTRDANQINWFPIPQGWSEFAHVPNNLAFPQFTGADGFEAVAFRKGSEIVISYAGTNPNESLVGPDHMADYLLATGVGSVQLEQAAEYYLKIKAANPNAIISFTGHSLGGGLAALMGVFFGKQATTFDQAPFANSAEASLISPDVAANLRSYLVAQLDLNGGRKYSDTALQGLTDFLNMRAAMPMGEIPNTSLVKSINVQGEFLSGVPWNIPDRIGQSSSIPTNAPGVSGDDLHSVALLTAFLQSTQTALSGRTLNDVTFKLTDLLGMIFSRDLYRFDTDTANRNFLERLVQNEQGNAMVTRFTNDLWKLAQDGGLTMADDAFASVKLVSQTLIAFAMQMYYENTANATTATKELFTGITGGIQFDREDVSSSLATTKGYDLYFHTYLANAFTPSDRDRIEFLLPGLRDWYVQAGTSGMEATNMQNRGAFMLGGLGADSLTGGTGADLLVGNVGYDSLTGGAGSDTLLGGVGFDRYYWNTGDGHDQIEDADATGAIFVNGRMLVGGVKKAGHTDWESADGHIHYVMQGTDLVVTLDGTQILTVNEDFQGGQFGIRLRDLSNAPTDTLPVVNYTNDIPADRKYVLYADSGAHAGGPLGGHDETSLEYIIHGYQGDEDWWFQLNNLGNNQVFAVEGNDVVMTGSGHDRLYGGGGDDVLWAWNGNDVLEGDAGNDILHAGTGQDFVDGGLDNDVVLAGGGKDVVLGGDGADLLYGDGLNPQIGGGQGVGGWVGDTALMDDDYLDGQAGADWLFGFLGDDVLMGGAGADHLVGDIVPTNGPATQILYTSDTFRFGAIAFESSDFWFNSVEGGADFLDGGDGNDVLQGDGGNDVLYGGNQNDQLLGDDGTVAYVQQGDDLLDGGDGDDLLLGGGGADTLIGGEGNDELSGDYVNTSGPNEGDDVLDGGGGDDLLFGGAGDDVLAGGADDDFLTGQAGDDFLDGGDGSDELQGGLGRDTLVGGAGNDRLFGEDDNDTLFGEEGDDELQGNAGNDVLDGNAGNDLVFGQAGNDRLVGGDGNDGLRGDDGDDHLEGGAGDDVLVGDADGQVGGSGGNDLLIGGAGNDSLVGGGGQDTYVFNLGDGLDTIVEAVGENNRLVFGVDSGSVTLGIEPGDTLLMYVGNVGDVVRITGFSALIPGVAYPINSFEFADGTVLTYSQLLSARGFQQFGTALGESLVGTEYIDRISAGTGDDDVSGLGGADLLLGEAGNDRLSGGAGDDTLDGGDGNDDLSGGEGSNVLYGGAGEDVLFGEGVSDQLHGGAGNDTYWIGTPGHTIVELANEGIDTMKLAIPGSATYVLPDEVENVELRDDTYFPSDVINLIGNQQNNRLTGGDLLDGKQGNDTLVGLGDNIYVFGRGYGQDLIQTGQQTYASQNFVDYIQLLAGVATTDVTLEVHGNNLVLKIAGTTDQITVENYLLGFPSTVGTIQFADGTIWGGTEITDQLRVITGTNGDDTLTGLSNDNDLFGLAGNDQLYGLDGNDRLDGGTGIDVMVGGLGNDTDVVDNVGDTVTENPNEGTDLVESSVTYTLGANVENLTLTGTTAINGTGNTLNNALVGNGAANLLDGGTGADAMTGGDGNDTYVVDSVSDTVTENLNEGTDLVQSSVTYTLGASVENLTLTGTTAINGTGNTLDNTLIGNSGANVLTGGTGADSMTGGAGNDTYVVDNVSDTVTENVNEGTDLVQSAVTYTLGANVENLTLTGTTAINGTGNSSNNTMTGNSGNNVLDGGTGTDAMSGGTGNDTYVVDNASDTVTEAASAGTDTVQSAVTFTLGTNVENLTLTGTMVINGTGNTLNNALVGNGAANLLDGGTGADAMTGGTGDDTYVVDNVSDTVTENLNEGTDLVQSAITYTLGAHLENLTLTGTGAINGTGNTLDNSLTGNSGANVLTGGAGSDTYVVGTGDSIVENTGAGTDTVQSGITWTLGANIENLTLTGATAINGTGNTLDNILTGNSGANVLTGGAGNDTYVVGTGDSIVENAGAGTDTVQSSITWTLGANLENLTLTGVTASNGTGNTANNTLIGNSANNVLTGLSGNDTYAYSRGGGQDTVVDNAGASDAMVFGTTITPMDVVISRQANDLRLAIHGSTDHVTIQNWYSSTTNQVETLQAGNGQTLLHTQVDQLIQAMASFSQQSGLTWDQALDQRPQDVQAVLAASWQ